MQKKEFAETKGTYGSKIEAMLREVAQLTEHMHKSKLGGLTAQTRR